MENPDSVNLFSKNYEEVNKGEEVMVEIVGSDVFVEEGNSGSKRIGDFEEVKNREETNFATNGTWAIRVDPSEYFSNTNIENPNNVHEVDITHVNEIFPIENKNESLGIEIEVDTEDNNQSTTNLSCEKLTEEHEPCFSVSDLVWGKVKSHPWWPGQIFDQSDASKKAMKHHKKGSFLVAYFGDQTFAWNDSSSLKPFAANFSQTEKQSNSEAFQNAVNCALEEVSRRVELGLACACVPKDTYKKIEYQVVENSGIREESRRRYGVDECSRSFQPEKIFQYVRELARSSSCEDRIDLVKAQSQLSAFYRFNGQDLTAGIFSAGELMEDNVDPERVSDKKKIITYKRKQSLTDNSRPRKKERSAGDRSFSSDDENDTSEKDSRKFAFSKKKQRKLDFLVDGSDKRITTKHPFKIGERILRVASQLKGSTQIEKENPEIEDALNLSDHSQRRIMFSCKESFPPNEMLLKLKLLAKDPKKRHDLLSTTVLTFFSGFRSSITPNKRGRNTKDDKTNSGSGEEFEFDDMNDSYWSENGEKDHLIESSDSEKNVKSGRKSHSRKRFSGGNELDENVERRRQESAPAELILNFSDKDSVPSEIKLNKIFRRFGQLMESETEVDRDSGRAKVIFRRGSDAEVACNSAEKFNIFGSVSVNFQVGYSPLISVKISPLEIPNSKKRQLW